MSLTPEQQARTASELAANLNASGLSVDQVRQRTGLSTDRFARAMTVSGADPVDVWLVRDTLETAVTEAGREPARYSVLTEQARSAASGWFGVSDRR